ncbi:MAG: hypothetical protein ABI647_04650 [Gemmatimonadota bacterium]
MVAGVGMHASRVLASTVACCVAALALHWLVERRRLRRFVRALDLPARPVQRVLWLAAYLSNRPHVPDDPAYLSRVFRPLGATPGSLIRDGGCCSGTSRLFILCLAELGIRAHQITLYHRGGRAQHCLVEAYPGDVPLIADPVYGVYFTDTNGRLLSLEDLQAGASVACLPLANSTARGYPAHNYYDFDYALTQTANWTKSWPRRRAYTMLRALSGRRIDRLRLPDLLEWPQVLLASLIVLFAVVLEIAGFVIAAG